MTIDELRDYIDKRTYDSETRILTALHTYASRIESLMKVQRSRTDGVEERLFLVEERLNNLEAKK